MKNENMGRHNNKIINKPGGVALGRLGEDFWSREPTRDSNQTHEQKQTR
jgi:hypothetical protein